MHGNRTNKRFIVHTLFCLLAMVSTGPSTASAAPVEQVGVGSVAGTIADADGRPLANAMVTIDVHSGFPWLAETDANGRFRLDGVATTRSVELKSYRAGYLYGDVGIQVTAGQLTQADAKLAIQPATALAPVLTDPRIEPSTAAPGETITLSAMVVDPDKDLAPEWLVAGSPRFGRGVNLKPMGNSRFQATFTIPAGTAPGTYPIVFFAADDACNVNGGRSEPFPRLPLTVRAGGATAAPAAQPFPSGAPDYATAGGWFYSQAGGGAGRGYTVTDEGGVRFWSELRRLGGPTAVGYPASQRLQWDGFTVQVFQRVIFQWRPESGSVAFVNVFDRMHDLGKDDFLLNVRQTPVPRPFADANKPFDAVVASHLAVLDGFPALKAAYLAQGTDPVQANGLPVSDVIDMGNHFALRAQRVVLQQWKQDVPWAKAGQVTVALGGDIAKEAGILPDSAAFQPIAPPR